MKKKILAIVAAVLVVAGAGVFAFTRNNPKEEESVVEEPSSESSVEESTEPEEESSIEESSEEESSVEESSSEESSESSEEESSEESEPEIPIDALPQGYVYSQLTGLPITEEISLQRPVAVMYNNHLYANPQSGMSGADIVYEIVVEGSITRYMAVFQDYLDLQKMGSIRSTRRYFLDFAMDASAVLVHFGRDGSITDVFDQIGCKHLEGMWNDYNYWRSSDRVAPHNVFTTGQDIADGLEAAGYGAKLKKPIKEPMFQFYQSTKLMEEERKVETESESAFPVTHITIPYLPSSNSMNIVPEYFYNEETKMYERSIYGGEQRDQENGERIACKNVLIQIANIYPRGDEKGHMDMDTIGEGDGYYICEGVAIPVKWKKESQKKKTMWYLESGERLTMVPGKTWISIVSLTQDYTLE